MRYSPNDSFQKTPDIRVRELPEWGNLLVYTPAHPDIHYLDARSWLLFELCDGRTFAEVVDEFSQAVPDGTPRDDIHRAVTEAISTLEAKGIVTRTAAAQSAAA